MSGRGKAKLYTRQETRVKRKHRLFVTEHFSERRGTVEQLLQNDVCRLERSNECTLVK